MRVPFTKMHGNGNDFVLIDATAASLDLDSSRIRHIAQRRFGVGCDQLLVAEPASRDGADLAMRIYNTDGSTAGHCGNGLRSFAVFARERGLVASDDIRVEIPGGVVVASVLDDGIVRTWMGQPRFAPASIPLAVAQECERYEVDVAGAVRPFSALSMGNPHAVFDVDDVASAPVASVGAALQEHALFPQGVNVGFCAIQARDRVSLRVFERGVGETPACGSGACAAVVAGIRRGELDTRVHVELPGGSLLVAWAGSGHDVELTGPATHVFSGEIDL